MEYGTTTPVHPRPGHLARNLDVPPNPRKIAMLIQTIAAFAFGLVPGAAIGLILMCVHIVVGREAKPTKWKLLMAQLPFFLGPLLMAAASLEAIVTRNVHPPSLGVVAGVIVGMMGAYGVLYFRASRG